MYLHTVPEAEYFDVDSGEDDPSEQDGHHHKDRPSLPVRVTFRFLFRYHNESGTHAFADSKVKLTFYSRQELYLTTLLEIQDFPID